MAKRTTDLLRKKPVNLRLPVWLIRCMDKFAKSNDTYGGINSAMRKSTKGKYHAGINQGTMIEDALVEKFGFEEPGE